MRKIAVLNVIELNNIIGTMILAGAPIEDVKAIVRFRREVKPVVDAWNEVVKDIMEKLKPADGATISKEEFNARLNEALNDEAKREVEVTPFTLSEAGEEVILAQSKITFGELEYLRSKLND
jgi:hypothetical protein